MTAGTRRNGISKLGPLSRSLPGLPAKLGRAAGLSRTAARLGRGEQDTQPHDFTGDDYSGHDHTNHHDYTGRHASPRGKLARLRAGKAVPVAAAAATLAAGTAAYLLVGGSTPHSAQLNAALAQGASSRTSGATIGHTNGSAAGIIKPTTATDRGTGKATSRATTSHAAKRATAAATHASAAPVTHSAAPAASASASAASAPAKAATLSCDLSGGLLPENVSAIVSFLLAHGYSDNATAGMAGNIYQESKGNPESVGMGGGGLIGWTPLPSGFVTGNVTADLDTQLSALLTYNEGWHQYIAELNAASTPADAAYIYVTMFERAGIPAASTREAAATDVAAACGI